MPKSLSYMPPGFFAGMFHGEPLSGLIWGGICGIIIGGGISLSIGLFYSSALGMIAAVILVSGILGALFGQTMTHLLVAEENRFERPETSGLQHRIAGKTSLRDELIEHRRLSAEMKDKIIINQ